MIHFNMNSTKVFYIIPTNWGQSKSNSRSFLDDRIIKGLIRHEDISEKH